MADAADGFDYVMPSLGADMDEGRVVEWRVAPGDTVHRGDLMAVVETEKSDIDIEIWHDGVVEAFLVDVGELVAVGTPIARLRRLDHETSSTSSGAAATASASARVPASPLARRLAAEHGIDLGPLHGSGPGGAIVESDVRDAMSAATTVPAATTEPPRRSSDTMRTLIAARMSAANRDIPHYHLTRELDVGRLETWLSERNADRTIAERVLPAACYIRAVAMAAARHRELNGFWVDHHFEPATSVNVAMAISLRGGGLITPQIERADERSLDDVMSALTELVASARTGTLRASAMTGATITVTHLGETGADSVHGVISPPQVALVGFGRTRVVPRVVGGALVAAPVVTSTLAADHRATDGVIGSRFLATLANLIDEPEQL